MKYTKDNINGVTFKTVASDNIYIVDPYKLDKRGLIRVDGWSDDRIVATLNNGDWVEVIEVNGKWVKGQKFLEPEIY